MQHIRVRRWQCLPTDVLLIILTSRLPGPAGRFGTARPAGAASTASFVVGVVVGGAGGGGEVSSTGVDGPRPDPDFISGPWLQALKEGGIQFDEHCEPFKGNTLRVAAGVQQNTVLDRLLVVVASVKRCHSGEAFVRLKDPTGSLGGTLTRAALEGEPDIRQGAVLRLRRVTVLRTPPPRSLNHLCITLDSVVQVIPPPANGRRAAGAARTQPHLQLPAAAPALLPRLALPAPPPAAPRLQQLHAPPAAPGPQQLQLFSNAAPACASQQGMPPPPARQQLGLPGPAVAAAAAAAAPASSFAWTPASSLVAAPSADPPHQAPPACQQQLGLPQPPLPAASSFGWPSLGAARAPSHHHHQQQQQQPLPPPPPQQATGSLSVGFAGPRLPQQLSQQQEQQPLAGSLSVGFVGPLELEEAPPPSQEEQRGQQRGQQRCAAPGQDSAGGGGAPAQKLLPGGGGGCGSGGGGLQAGQGTMPRPRQQRQQGGAPPGWLQGLLAEADFDPFAGVGLLGSQATQLLPLPPSLPLPLPHRHRPVLAERQPGAVQQQQQAQQQAQPQQQQQQQQQKQQHKVAPQEMRQGLQAPKRQRTGAAGVAAAAAAVGGPGGSASGTVVEGNRPPAGFGGVDDLELG